MTDLAAADAAGNYKLAHQIAERIRALERPDAGSSGRPLSSEE